MKQLEVSLEMSFIGAHCQPTNIHSGRVGIPSIDKAVDQCLRMQRGSCFGKKQKISLVKVLLHTAYPREGTRLVSYDSTVVVIRGKWFRYLDDDGIKTVIRRRLGKVVMAHDPFLGAVLGS